MAAASIRAVLAALLGGDADRALALTIASAAEPGAPRLAAALADHLGSTDRANVYDAPEGFEAFIAHGSNPTLYERTIEHLRSIHATHRPPSVLDIGCGDGRVTVAVLDGSTRRVDLVEPSEALLRTAVERLDDPAPTIGAHQLGIGEFLDAGDGDGDGDQWTLAQATFALHNLAPSDRAGVLSRLAHRVGHLVVVEFDVPVFEPGSEQHLDHLAERYEVGIGEYVDHPEAISGFLMPVLAGQLEPGRQCHTFEQPASRWVDELVDAGFRDVDTAEIFDYWWGPAVAVTGRGAQL